MRTTPRGIGVAAATVVLFVLAIALRYPEVGMVAMAGLIALALGLGAIVRRPRLEIDRLIAPEKVTRGDGAYGELKVRNVALLPSAPVVAEEPCGDRTIPVDIRRLGPGDTVTKHYRLPTERRGVIPIGPLRLTRRDRFALFQRVQTQGERTELWVRPVVHALRSLPVGSRRALDGPDEDRAQQGSITFDRLREWQMGDDPRHIHWRSTARAGTLIVREHVDTTLPRLVVVLDDRIEASEPAVFEEAVEVAASLLAAAAQNGFPATFVSLGGGRAQSRGSARSASLFLDALTQVERTADHRTDAALLDASRAGGRGTLVLVTTGRGLGSLDAVLAARRRFDNLSVVIVDPDEPTIPALADIRCVWTATGEGFPDRWAQVVR